MRFIPKYRVCYKGTFYKAGQEFRIEPKDETEMKQHGRVVDDSTPLRDEPKKAGRPRRGEDVVHERQPVKAEAKNRRG